MFDFGKNGENLTEEKVKKYFKENNFFGLQSYTVNFEAKELIIFAMYVPNTKAINLFLFRELKK